MAQLSNDCFAFGGELMSVDDATALIAERIAVAAAVEDVPLMEADGRVLADRANHFRALQRRVRVEKLDRHPALGLKLGQRVPPGDIAAAEFHRQLP